MQLTKWLIAVPLALTMLSGCAFLEKLVYRIDISQGNFVEQSAVDQLRIGMSKEQVRYVLGSPMLVENGKPNKWYYIYHFTKGHNDPEQKNLFVFFGNDERLERVEGDFSVGPAFNQAIQ
ncbi:outer membrane protein assembly factor BamE [Vibrio superstes]|uniref:Outer membrane protein assembly factor BamE n=1 Tax=Vibrio superstes NBRC 103154 TaxID=1219062 RepID=A0A511QN26_9VIBR|nr:outer membrane protein assembly factor BamE [Vibrio superstes]GEM78734.1 outer membrane protein assembly factor BamE [Vibrio superstes NBRC 103154]